MSDKGPEAFRTISEVATDLDLPQHVLRFWETKFSQIRPLKGSSGRRFYRPEDVALVRSIRDMLYGQGYTIRGVQRLLKERGRTAATETAPVTAAVHLDADAVENVADDTAAVQTALDFAPQAGVVRIDADLAAALRAVAADLRDCATMLADAHRA